MTRSGIERRFKFFRRTGDPAALAAVFDATAPEVLRVAMHLARDPGTAEDLLQRTFLTAIESAAAFDGTRRVLPWLLGILSNHAHEAARRAARTPDPERLPRREAESPEAAAAAREALEAAGSALDALPDPARSILVLRFRHGLEPAEIADALGIPPATVRSHLHRGTERLRRSVPRGLALPAAFLGSPPRGLAEVRRVVVARARDAGPAVAAASATAVAAAVPLVVGGLLVKKTALAVAAAVLLFGGGGAWLGSSLVGGAGDRPAGPPAAPAPADAPAPTLAKAERAPSPAGDAIPAAADGAAVRVLVLDPDGKPVARVGMVVITGTNVRSTEFVHAVTDEMGRARLTGLSAGKYGIWLGNGCGEHVEVPSKDGAEVVIRMRRGVTVEGDVVDPSGVPVAGAEVWIDPQSSRWTKMARAATSDAEGRFRIADAGSWCGISARALGFAPSGTRRILGDAGQTERVRLVLGARGGSVRGLVLDGGGRPIAGALVLIGWRYGAPRDLPDGTQGTVPLPAILRTDAEGVFTAQGLASGPTQLMVRARGFAALLETREVAQGPAVTEWRVELPSTVALEGTVFGSDGKPVAGATVATHPRHDVSWFWLATADAEGRYRIDDLPVNEVLYFRAAAYSAKGVEIGSADFWISEGPAGETLRRDVTLKPPSAARIEVRVLAEDGSPLGGLWVGALTSGDIQPSVRARSSPEGLASLEAKPFETYRLEVLDPAGDDWTPCAVVFGVRAGGAESEVRVRDAARPRSRITATLATASGEIPVGTRAWAVPRGGRAGVNLTLDRATGRLESRLVPAGSYDLAVSAPGYGTVPFGRRRIAVGETLDWGTLRLGPTGSLLVHCRGGEKAAMSGVSVFADAGLGGIWGLIGTNGDARIAKCPPGAYLVTFSGGPWGAAAAGSVAVEAGREATLDLTVVAGHERKIRIEGAKAEDFAGMEFSVRESGAASRLVSATFGAGSDPAIDVTVYLAPGKYAAEAETVVGRRATAEFEVRGDDAEPVVLRFAK